MATPINYKPGTFARFFRAVKGRNVSRFGTARYMGGFRAATIIGGARAPMAADASGDELGRLGQRGANVVEHDLAIVTAITHHEARRYAREYNRAVSGGDLREATEADYMDYLRADAEHAAKVAEKNEAVAKAQAKAAKREDELASQQDAARANKRAPRKARKSKRTTSDAADGGGARDGSDGPAPE